LASRNEREERQRVTRNGGRSQEIGLFTWYRFRSVEMKRFGVEERLERKDENRLWRLVFKERFMLKVKVKKRMILSFTFAKRRQFGIGDCLFFERI